MTNKGQTKKDLVLAGEIKIKSLQPCMPTLFDYKIISWTCSTNTRAWTTLLLATNNVIQLKHYLIIYNYVQQTMNKTFETKVYSVPAVTHPPVIER